MPAAPIMGLTFFLVKRFMILPKITPPAVSKINAARPSARIMAVLSVMKDAACMLAATVMPSIRVIRFASTFCAVSEREPSTPHSRMRLPNIRKPTSATERGAKMPAMTVTMIGKRIFVDCETLLPVYSIRMLRSFFVVSSLMIGGWTIGTSAM